ncbi:hypothetical protein BN136_539 [Cronobacter universalis NCTC 9529]|nr:hypothetical protein BN136_539 [Cronobacter universalis NCTC 9529]
MFCEADPVIRHLSCESAIRRRGVVFQRLDLIQVIKHVRHFIAVPRAVGERLPLANGDIIKPVAPARHAASALRLHHHKAERGERHIAADLSPQFAVAAHAGVQQPDKPEPETPFAAQLADLLFQIDAKIGQHAGFIAVTADHHRHRMLARGEEGLEHRLRQHDIARNRRRPGDIWRGERPEGIGGQRAQISGGGIIKPEMTGKRRAITQRFTARDIRQRVAALDNRFMEQPFRERRGHQRQHAARPGGFAKERDVVTVTAKGGDVILHPAQRGDLIEQRKVINRPGRIFAFQRRMGEKAEMPEPAPRR